MTLGGGSSRSSSRYRMANPATSAPIGYGADGKPIPRSGASASDAKRGPGQTN